MAKELVVYKAPKTPAIKDTPFKRKAVTKPKTFMSKAKYVIKKGIRLSTGALALGAAAYAAGGKSRRYAKAPKVGEDRDLRDMILSQPDKRTLY
jgi:hypothetical protein